MQQSKINQIGIKERPNPSDISTDVIGRWSPRNMTGEALTVKDLEPLFTAASWAPSSNNNQPWRYYVAYKGSSTYQDLFDLLVEGNQSWAEKSGALIILVSRKVAEYKQRPIRSHSFDTGASWMNFAIEGARRNLVVHAMGGFDVEGAHSYLKLTDDDQVECMVAVGKPGKIDQEEVTQRNGLEDFVVEL